MRLSHTCCAWHHLQRLDGRAAHTWAIEVVVLHLGVCKHMQSLRGQCGGCLHLDCLRELRGENWNLATFLERAVAVMKYSCFSCTTV